MKHVVHFNETPHSDNTDFARSLVKLLKDRINIRVLQIGAGSPGELDPCSNLLVDNKSWSGYLFEPNPTQFLKCSKFYQKCEGRVKVICAAVSAGENYIDFVDFYIRRHPNLSSLSTSHRKEGAQAEIVDTITVPSFSLPLLVEKLRFPELIQIDTEGMDVLMLLSLFEGDDKISKLMRNRKEGIISFEYCHSNPENMQRLASLLYESGYSCKFRSSFDAIFVK